MPTEKKRDIAYKLDIIPLEDFDFIKSSEGYEQKHIGDNWYYLMEEGDKKKGKKYREDLIKMLKKGKLEAGLTRLVIYKRDDTIKH